MKQKRRPEIMRPGLKLLTPLELKKVSSRRAIDYNRWMALFDVSCNRWRLIK